jgi:hypothetical protein
MPSAGVGSGSHRPTGNRRSQRNGSAVVPRQNEWRIKADSLTPASLRQGFSVPPYQAPFGALVE